MIRLCIFDMGGVVIRDFHVAPELLSYLGRTEVAFGSLTFGIRQALHEHSMGLISEDEFWDVYERETSSTVDRSEGSLLGKFFHPVLDMPTVEVIQQLKKQNIRVVCGTNVIDAHFNIHHGLKQYDVFDHVYASHQMHLAKPDRAFYRCILEQEHSTAEDVFFTDDMEANVLAARQEGINAHVYTDAGQLVSQLKAQGIEIIL